jgi:hypothetical protein
MRSARPTEVKASALEPRRNDTVSDLFPDALPAATPAIWPTAGTRKADALAALIAGPQNQCDYQPGWRLAAYVQSLEYDGWCIRSRLFKHPRCARPIAEYTLDRQDPATAAALAKRKQAGGITPELVAWLAVVAGPAAAAGAVLLRAAGWL